MTCWLATLNIERFFLQFRLPAESAREWCVWSMHIWELSRVKTSNMYMQSARQSRIRRGRVELSMLYVKLKWLEIDFEMAFLAAAERIDVVVKRVFFLSGRNDRWWRNELKYLNITRARSEARASMLCRRSVDSLQRLCLSRTLQTVQLDHASRPSSFARHSPALLANNDKLRNAQLQTAI